MDVNERMAQLRERLSEERSGDLSQARFHEDLVEKALIAAKSLQGIFAAISAEYIKETPFHRTCPGSVKDFHGRLIPKTFSFDLGNADDWSIVPKLTICADGSCPALVDLIRTSSPTNHSKPSGVKVYEDGTFRGGGTVIAEGDLVQLVGNQLLYQFSNESLLTSLGLNSVVPLEAAAGQRMITALREDEAMVENWKR